jgi:hypothetical protein
VFLPNGHGQEAQRAKQGPLQRGVLAITPAPLPPVGYLDRNQGQLKNETCNATGSYQRDDTPYSRAFNPVPEPLATPPLWLLAVAGAHHGPARA